ncbi:2Fe-2S iron-sulfur cluster-binding protein [Deinococcus sp. S9]|uniref:2Fe-2S iron-sulfur cluster-binding protein n=1 Tax=Deinococcus sp. S9 TaxID=2545754 RepID=UPI0010545ED4|nr:2Fe-2S iron-sulfur cluster-binding protein [Deinococcus sp. S9]TDE87016.1 (2Fe-2S)-binding protein [Deinococcus sp. S9]
MPRITAEGYGVIGAREGERLVLALERGGVDILHRCGGHARCTTCRVHFTEGEPERMTVAERDKLTEKGLLGEARLSCQIECRGDMVLRALQTVGTTGLEPGKEPAEFIEPEPVWVSLLTQAEGR